MHTQLKKPPVHHRQVHEPKRTNNIQQKHVDKRPAAQRMAALQRLAATRARPQDQKIAQLKSLADANTHDQLPIQRQPTNLKAQMGAQHGVDLSGVKEIPNSSFPASVSALATIQGNRIDYAPSQFTTANRKHELGHAIDNAKHGTPRGDTLVNGQNVDTTRERAAQKIADTPVQRIQEGGLKPSETAKDQPIQRLKPESSQEDREQFARQITYVEPETSSGGVPAAKKLRDDATTVGKEIKKGLMKLDPHADVPSDLVNAVTQYKNLKERELIELVNYAAKKKIEFTGTSGFLWQGNYDVDAKIETIDVAQGLAGKTGGQTVEMTNVGRQLDTLDGAPNTGYKYKNKFRKLVMEKDKLELDQAPMALHTRSILERNTPDIEGIDKNQISLGNAGGYIWNILSKRYAKALAQKWKDNNDFKIRTVHTFLRQQRDGNDANGNPLARYAGLLGALFRNSVYEKHERKELQKAGDVQDEELYLDSHEIYNELDPEMQKIVNELRAKHGLESLPEQGEPLEEKTPKSPPRSKGRYGH